MSLCDAADLSTGFFEAFYTFVLFEAFLSRRKHVHASFYYAGAAALGILIDISNHLFSTNMLNMAVVIAMELLFSIMYAGRLQHKLIPSVFSFMITVVTEVVVLLCMSVFLNGDARSIVEKDHLRVIGVVLSKVFGCAAALFMANKVKLRRDYEDNSYWFLFILMLLSVTITMNFFYRIIYMGVEKDLRIQIYFSAVGVVIITLVMTCLYRKIVIQREELEKEHLAYIKLTDQIKYYKDTIAAYDKLRGFRHDINKHLLAIKAIAERNETAECTDYINRIIKDNVIAAFEYKTGNTVLDAMLSSKRAEAEQAGISFQTKLRIPSQLPIKDEDICVIFGNALDNAIEACAKTERNKYISVNMIYDGCDLVCRIENSYAGNRPPMQGTTKENSFFHGLGRENIDRSLKKYSAVSDVEITDRAYSLSMIFPDIST